MTVPVVTVLMPPTSIVAGNWTPVMVVPAWLMVMNAPPACSHVPATFAGGRSEATGATREGAVGDDGPAQAARSPHVIRPAMRVANLMSC